jgi:hypothetical protein
MKTKIKLDAVYSASRDVVVRQVEDEVILFPYASGEDDSENEPYFLKTTGKAIWERFNGKKKLQHIIVDLAARYNTPVTVIEKDVLKFVEKLIQKKLLVKISEA